MLKSTQQSIMENAVLFSVYFLQATFSENIETASIDSPIYSQMANKSCLNFFYRLSSTSVILQIYAKYSDHTANFALLHTLRYELSFFNGSWKKAFIDLGRKLVQIRFVASKVFVTEDSVYVNVDRISLSENCSVIDTTSTASEGIA